VCRACTDDDSACTCDSNQAWRNDRSLKRCGGCCWLTPGRSQGSGGHGGQADRAAGRRAAAAAAAAELISSLEVSSRLAARPLLPWIRSQCRGGLTRRQFSCLAQADAFWAEGGRWALQLRPRRHSAKCQVIVPSAAIVPSQASAGSARQQVLGRRALACIAGWAATRPKQARPPDKWGSHGCGLLNVCIPA
jgi:hypothetical protein